MSLLAYGVQRFQRDVFPEHADLFAGLADGQAPHTLFLTCADSRIDPSLITQTKPGELFVIRNAGNMVPPHDSGAHGESASIEYAVQVLKVQHIVVCGHTGCGAMAALHDGVADLPHVQAWLQYAVPPQPPASLDDTIQFNITQQLKHLRTYPFVEAAVSAGRLQLHGWLYNIASGEVLEYQPNIDKFMSLHASAPVGDMRQIS